MISFHSKYLVLYATWKTVNDQSMKINISDFNKNGIVNHSVSYGNTFVILEISNVERGGDKLIREKCLDPWTIRKIIRNGIVFVDH